MKTILHQSVISLSLVVLCSLVQAKEYTLKPGDVIKINTTSGKTTYFFNSDGKSAQVTQQNNLAANNIQKRIHLCHRLVSAHQDAGLHRHHEEDYLEVERLLEISKKHPLSQYKSKAEISITSAEKILIKIEKNYPNQSFSSIRNCFNLTSWEQCI